MFPRKKRNRTGTISVVVVDKSRGGFKEPADIVEWMLAQEKASGTYHEYYRKNGERLIVGYSEQRAKKDAHNREKGIERLRKAYSSGVLTKVSINRRGYNKFLTISKDVQVVINEQEIENDAKWDGLKGYVTNTDLDAEQVVAQYHSLWYVERAFRITKGNLEARPIFHFTEKRIEAHICICFIAYKVYKELQRIGIVPPFLERIFIAANIVLADVR